MASNEPNGHRISGNEARDNSRVQYGNIHGGVTNNNWTTQQQTSPAYLRNLSQNERDESLAKAARYGQLQRLQLLVAAEANLDYHDKEYGFTALHHAVRKGRHECAEYLLRHGADVNARSRLGLQPRIAESVGADKELTALHFACMKTMAYEMVSLLTEHGADLDAKTLHDRTPLLSFLDYDGVEASDAVSTLDRLVAFGASLDLNDNRGRTVLHLAVMSGNLSLIRRLLDHLAKSPGDLRSKLEQKDHSGNTVLMYATFKAKNHETVRIILERGADFNAKNFLGDTPLIMASESPGNSDVLELFLDEGADVNARDDYGFTPLMTTASFYGDIKMARLLLERGAFIDAQETHGKTALIFAAEDEDTGFAEALLQHGADTQIRTKKGENAREIVMGKKNEAMLRLFSEYNVP